MNAHDRNGARQRPKDQRPALSLLVIGPGAVGSYVGGSLAFHGHRVVFLGTPGSVERLRREGMLLSLERQEIHLPSPAVENRLEACLDQGPFQAAILTLKSYDTPQFAAQLGHFKNEIPPILCLQNGVDNEPLLASILGDGGVIPGTVTSAVGRASSGKVILERKRGLGLSANHPLSSRLWEALDQAELKPRRYHHPQAMKWSKLLTNLLANASAAILDMAPAEIFTHPDLYRLEQAQFQEALRVMKALGLPVVNLPGVPVKLLAMAFGRWPASLSRPLLGQILGRGRGGKMPSLHIDLQHGREQSEVTFLNGAVVAYGSQCGVATPVNRALTETLSGLVRRELRREAFAHQPDRLLALL